MRELNDVETSRIPLRQSHKEDEIEIYQGPMNLHSGMDAVQKPDSKGMVDYSWYPFQGV